MSNQIVISSGAKVRSLNGVITGTTGVLDSLPINAANGIPQLDVNGKILVSQLPNSVMEYQGTWNANTNTPTLTNGGAFNQGDVYLCNVAGTTNFGAGPIAFVVGDQVIYSGSIWQKASGSTGTVTSVAVTESGDALTITGSPITTSGTINIGFAGISAQYVAGNGALVTFPTLISSIGLSMPSAFSVANSPLTANGTIAVTGAGVASQYIRGDGTLADFPSSGGGGSSVSYYLNGGTSQGVIGGVTYYEMSKTADTGTGVDFPKTGDGLIVSFLTDANDPAQLNIPSGNWNYEIYVSMSANGGTPQLYAELYKYDGTTFTLISTSSNEIIYDGTTLNMYTFAMAVPTTTLTVTDRLAVKLYAANSGGKTTTVHTQNGHLCQVITTFSTGITALNGLTTQVQYFQVGTSGTDFNISSATATHTFNLPTASAANRGALSSADWTTFNNKASTADLANYLPLTGGTLSGLLNISTASYLTSRLKLTNTATGGNIWSVSSGNANNSINNSLFTIINETLSKNTFVLSPTGKLAIGENLGTINPADALSVYDTNTILRVFDLTGNGSSVVLQATNTASYVNAAYNTTAIPLILRTANTTRLTIAATGEATFAAGLTGTTANFTGQLTLGSTITNGTYTYTLPSATGTLALTSSLSSYLPLTGGTLTGALSGTSASFSGTISCVGNITVNGGGVQSLIAQSSGSDALVRLNNTTTTTGKNFYITSTSVGNLQIVGTNSIATFSDSGNLGLGVTPSAWGSGQIAFDIGTLGGLSTDGSSMVVANNRYFNGTNNIYKANGYSNLYSQGGGSHVWYNAPSGTAGNAISFTQAMTLDASGRLALGRTSADHRLDVQGNILVRNTLANASFYLAQEGDNSSTLYQYNNGTLKNVIASNGTSYFNGGNVGIGTSSPIFGSRFQVKMPSTTFWNGITAISSTDESGIYMGHNGTVGAIGTTYGSTGSFTPLIFQTSEVERMRITSGGQAIIGSTASLYANVKLSVKQTAANIPSEIWSAYSGDLGSAALMLIKNDNSSSSSQVFLRFVIDNGNTANGQINGNGASQVAFGSWSDRRLKENIKNLPSQLSNIMALRPVEFDYKNGSGHQIGFIAQEMQEVYSDVVGEDSDGFLTITGWSKTEARLVKAIQEQQKQIEELKAKIK